MDSNDPTTAMKIRDINEDDISEVYQFIIKEQGSAMHACDKRYIEALIGNDELRIEGKISYPMHEKRLSSPPKTDFLKWIVESKRCHFGKVACLSGGIIGVLLCYTKSRGLNIAYISNMAVAGTTEEKE